MSKPLITLFTDASWCPDSQVAGWAAWFKENGIARRYHGGFKDRYASISLAETAALVNGIWLIAKLYNDAQVIAQTDSLDAIRVLTGQATGQYQPIRERWDWVCREYRLDVQLRHVKGHRGKRDPRSAINSWCDEYAKHEMRQLRAKHARIDHSVHI